MTDLAREITPVTIEDELKRSYMDYAMSVIIGRALPDVRDGLKPVHRRVLYAMSELNNDWNKPHKKSARVVGDVIGKYHPHGDTAVYDTIVRMAQPFAMRYMLVDGQGNFGSVDGDAAAAMRYTEVRMSKFAHELLADLDKETVDFVPNYDETEFCPAVLPAKVPNLLVNGSAGIAVGMATNIPPHNLTETINACLALLDSPDMTIDELMQHIPGPDFPTAGIINGKAGIVSAYRTGRGRLYVRAKTEIENDETSGRQAIIVTELPYQVNKAKLIEKIAELVKDKRIEGISGLRDESDKDGMRVVIELKRGEIAEVIVNNLYTHTQLQNVFGINMVALIEGQPRLLNLKQILQAFLKHRREVITRRTIFDVRKAKERAHLLEGLGVALSNIEEVIQLIKASANPQEAKDTLLAKAWEPGVVRAMLAKTEFSITRPDTLPKEFGLEGNVYHLSPEQAQAILDLRLHRLTGLEKDKIFNEYEELIAKINDLLHILTDPERLKLEIRKELLQMTELYGDARRTAILDSEIDLTTEDLITEENVVLTLSYQGYAKTQSLDNYRAQKRGGRGKSATEVKEEDYIQILQIANTHDYILCFTDRGKVYWLKTYEFPQASRASRGKPIVNMLPLEQNERVNAILPIRTFDGEHYVFMATAKGTVKKVSLEQFSRPRSNGIIAIDLDAEDRLVGVALTDGQQDVMLFSNTGKVIRFKEEDVRGMGRTARGVRGIKLQADQEVIALMIAKESGTILTATANGYGKRTNIEEYRLTGRGGQGVMSIQMNERNGLVVGACQVQECDEVMLISDKGTLVRTKVAEISVIGRNTQGVRLIRLIEGEQLIGLQAIDDIEDLAEDGEMVGHPEQDDEPSFEHKDIQDTTAEE
jgi:DNA gyrase subunit A